MSSAIILLVVAVGVYYLHKSGQLQPLLQKLGLGGGQTAQATPQQYAQGVEGTRGEIYQSVMINNNPQRVQFRFDTGADYSIMRTESAKLVGLNLSNPVRTQAVTGISGNVQAPVIQVTMQIGTAQPFQTEVIVFNSNFNLLSRRDMTRVYDVQITEGGVRFTPKGAMVARADLRGLEGLRTRYYMRL